jgi:hypothetical protein
MGNNLKQLEFFVRRSSSLKITDKRTEKYGLTLVLLVKGE